MVLSLLSLLQVAPSTRAGLGANQHMLQLTQDPHGLCQDDSDLHLKAIVREGAGGCRVRPHAVEELLFELGQALKCPFEEILSLPCPPGDGRLDGRQTFPQ